MSSSGGGKSSLPGGGRVRQIFAARNNTGLDKSLPLDPIGNAHRGREELRGQRKGISLDRGGTETKHEKKKLKKRSQSEHPKSKLVVKPITNNIKVNAKQEVKRKPHVIKPALNKINTRKPIAIKSTSKPPAKTTQFAPKPGLIQCKNCSRNFASDRIETHRNICKKTAKKRKPFDVSKSRVEGTDAANFTGKIQGKGKKKVNNI